MDLMLCILGNLCRPRTPQGRVKRDIHVAVVVPAHNEELMIARTVASVRAAELRFHIRSSSQLHGLDCFNSGNSEGAVLELNNSKLRGKGAALRHGFAAALAAGANAVLVVDADSVVSANLISATQAALEEAQRLLNAGTSWSFRVGINSAAGAFRVLAFRGMNVLRARGRAGLGIFDRVFGNGFAVTAADLERVPLTRTALPKMGIQHQTGRERHSDPVGRRSLRHAPHSRRRCSQGHPGGPVGRRPAAGSQHRQRGGCLRAVFHGKWRALETLADVWSLPLSRGILALLFTAALPVHWLHVFAIVCAAIAVLYVLETALLGAEPAQDLAALATAPVYLLWKAAITPMVVRQSRARASWARTKREGPQP